jgi:hypothetical protein
MGFQQDDDAIVEGMGMIILLMIGLVLIFGAVVFYVR